MLANVVAVTTNSSVICVRLFGSVCLAQCSVLSLNRNVNIVIFSVVLFLLIYDSPLTMCYPVKVI